jgi:hypothetical protein
MYMYIYIYIFIYLFNDFVYSNCTISKCWFAAWLVDDHLLLRDFGPYYIIFMYVCAVMTAAMVMLLRDFSPYVIFVS